MLKPGDRAPDLLLKMIDGQDIALAESWGGGQSVLIVFLRHLG